MPTINWIPAHTVMSGNKNAGKAAKRGLQLDGTHRSPATVSVAWRGQKGFGNEGFMEDRKLWGV